jgi:hypothetical protein
MKKNKTFSLYLGIFLILVSTFACSLFSPPQEDSPPPPPETVPTTEVASISPTLATAAPLRAVAAKSNGNLTLFDREGYTLAQISTTGIAEAAAENIHILGKFSQATGHLTAVYFSFEQNNALLLSDNGQITTLLATPDFSRLAGVLGERVIAYSTVEYLADGVGSALYVGTPDSIPIAAPILYEKNTEGWSLEPLAVKTEGEQAIGVWYSKFPGGIGGDIVFTPRRTLFYLDLRTDTSSQVLGIEANPSALSAEQNWLAYTNEGAAEAGIGTMTVRNLSTGATFSYPLQSTVDPRGAGNAVFSPDNSYLAWMEGSGWQMSETPNFHSVIRVGDLSGNVLLELADSAFAPVSGLGTVQRVEPVGWLDNQTLVVMARDANWDAAALITVDIPSQGLSFLAQGEFVEMVYLSE